MGYFNDLLSNALKSGRYTCSQCGARMEFEDENEDILICPKCGHSVDLDDYGSEDDFDDIIPDKTRTSEFVEEDEYESDDD